MQAPDGHWSGLSGGPHFLLGGLIVALYVTSTPVPLVWRQELVRYLLNVQRDEGPSDGGWGMCVLPVSEGRACGVNERSRYGG